MNTTEPKTYKILDTNFERLEAELAVLNKKADKLGVPHAVLITVGENRVICKDECDVEFTLVYKIVTIEGAAPKFDGWQLVASIETQDSGENLISCVPGQSCPVEFRTAGTHCDHCHTKRRRREVFVLRHDNGQHVQVGRQCIRDFLGGTAPESIVAWAEWGFDLGRVANDAEEEGWGRSGGYQEPVYNMKHFVKLTALCIRKLGWVSRTVAFEQGNAGTLHATADRVLWLLNPPTRRDESSAYKTFIREHKLVAEDRDLELAVGAIAWGKELATDSSEYLYNLGVTTRLGFVRNKTAGLVASLVSAYQRHLDKEAELKVAKASKKDRKHLGVIGERTQFPQVTIKAIRSFEGDWGVRSMIRFETTDGDILVFWKSGETDWEEGETLDITATVKKHEDWKGTPQTVIQRATKGLSKLKKKKAA